MHSVSDSQPRLANILIVARNDIKLAAAIALILHEVGESPMLENIV